MNYKAKSARMCHPMCHVSFMVALYESHSLYGFVGMCATYLIKLFNKYITVLVGHGVKGATGANNLTKLRILASQVAQVAPWLWV
jgi:hypothetical protein